MHRSYLDTLAVGVSLRGRRFRAMAKYELFLVPVIGRMIALGGGFPVRRGVQDMDAYEEAMRLLREGAILLVFPEGTRNRHGKARPQLGAARLALDAGAPFLPVSIAGTDRIRLLPPRFPKVRVYYGEPIPLDDLPKDDLRRASHTATKRWTAAIEAGLAKLRG
jgi:1-acyl-sn-glycerol-3-phosphate acyltransferase